MALLQISLLVILGLSLSRGEELKFPETFKFGVASASYQIEGGWNADGKGISYWDNLLHTNPGLAVDGSNGDIACDSYHKWQEDVQNLKRLGVNHYRFSLAWTRILPGGFVNNINQAGVDYYNNLIDALIDNDIEPMVTIYHWDLPADFTPLGTWTNEIIVETYTNFAQLAFKLFGDRVKTWITFNEPWVFCEGYALAFAGLIPYPSGFAECLCTQNVVKSHASAYHLYEKQFRGHQKGKVGITLNFDWYIPATNSPADVEAAEQRRQFDYGIYLNPLFNYDWPKIVETRVANRSELEGFPKSRLPEYTLPEQQSIHGAIDFLGINHYSSFLVKGSTEAAIGNPTFLKDEGTDSFVNGSWPRTADSSKAVYPQGLRELLNWIKDSYGNPESIITECGYGDSTGTTDDMSTRGAFFKSYLNSTLLAVVEDKCKVIGFTAWSFMDDFEWLNGYTVKFGFYQVNFTNPERTRVPKDSANYFTNVIKTRQL